MDQAVDQGEISKLFSGLVMNGSELALKAAQLICPVSLLNRGAELADMQNSIARIDFCPGISVFAVRGSRGKKYIVIPGKYCSCVHYIETVVRNASGWTCKHDLAVRLRLGLRHGEGIATLVGGKDLVINELIHFGSK